MMKNWWITRMVRLALLAASGTAVLGTSCTYDIRKSLVKAGLDFVHGAAGDFLAAAFPVNEILSNP